MVRYHPFSLACLILVVVSLAGMAGPIYHAVPTGSSALAEQLALETSDQRLNKLVEAKVAKAKSDFLEAVAGFQSGTTSSSRTAPYAVSTSRKPTIDKPYITSAKSTMRDTGFIPSFGYGPLLPNLGDGPSSESSPGSGMGGGGGNPSLAQAGTFSQVASLSSGSLGGVGTGGSFPVSDGSGPSSTGSGSGSGTDGGQNGTGGGGQGVTPVPGSSSTNQGDSSGNSSNPNNPVGSVIGDSGDNGSPASSGSGGPGPVVILPGSDPPIVPSIAAVPEPPAIALCLIGVGGILFMVAINRRTRR